MVSVPSERATLSPSDHAAKVRLCARLLQDGVEVTALTKAGRFSDREIAEARRMLREAKRKKKA